MSQPSQLTIAVAAAAAVAVFFSALLRLFAVSKLWLWFVVPFGLPAIGLGHALGLCLLVGLAKVRFKGKEEVTPQSALITMYLQPTLALVIGYVVKEFAL